MKFPGQRKIKHYFPVNADNRFDRESVAFGHVNTYVTGIDQNMVDITAQVDDAVLEEFGLLKGVSQLLADDAAAERLYTYLLKHELIEEEFAGGTIGNTLHNYSVLADDSSIQFGVMSENIIIGTSAYRYLCNTSSKVDLTHLQPVSGAIGRAFALITPDGERTFGISPGMMNELSARYIPSDVVAGGSALLLCAYTLANPDLPIYDATVKAAQVAKENHVPVVMTMGSRQMVAARREEFTAFLDEYVNVAAMNEEEAEALTGLGDPLMASEAILDLVDMVLLTAGPAGLYLSGYSDRDLLRQSNNPIRSGSIGDFNRYEFSRPMLRAQCEDAVKVFAQIDPYMGGPERISNTNGAGDGALAAVVHDIAANDFHRKVLPTSGKHVNQYLTYSSFAQVCKYANRVSYQVLAQSSPRLSRGLPEREDSLEEAYWDR
ncbi:inosine/guanosine kinase [Parendozoicomonas haliclonae]|uniref:Inosine-guanosine kinase n=1 Tax=Parendozoicomonas haliclonae TaxID=1960125 RepID=A0A1X7AEI6_9GAMM|nr:inosine/guanosine kinase [Parendozoicomonas haliclonae]SMA33165.1 Inosine-guanosine kinase [Parendozoicomonas haliclonae]